MKLSYFSLMVTFLFCLSVQAQDDEVEMPLQPLHNLQFNMEAQVSASEGVTPLWLNANKHGLSSLENVNGYMRAAVIRPLSTDSLRKWGIGYGVDVAVATNYTSDVIVQQAFAELRWLHGALSVGSKEYPMQLKNNALSSGSQTLGINARPVPQVRLSMPDYWTIPLTRGWVHVKGHLAFGMMTDDNWQKDFTHRQTKYTEGTLFHSKAGYLKIGGNNEFQAPLSLELGLEMASTFGGRSYLVPGWGSVIDVMHNQGGLRGMKNALMLAGSDQDEGVYHNAAGNQLGSWMARVNYDDEEWKVGAYIDHFFEDHSQLYFLGKSGYGTGDRWNNRTNGLMVYNLKDMLLGIELNLKYGTWLRNLVVEYIYTKDQSGPLYHDNTPNLPFKVSGIDNYYNHSTFTGWQHWGQVMGNPLYRSPIYNDDGIIDVRDNRFKAIHIGMSGQLGQFGLLRSLGQFGQLDYRLMATYQSGVGTYVNPYTKPHHNLSLMAEGIYRVEEGFFHGWQFKAAAGLDVGSILGNNYGLQITISKQLKIKD